MSADNNKRLSNLCRHIERVINNAKVLAETLLEEDDSPTTFLFAKQLIQNCYKHDNSKFQGIEWEYLTNGADKDDLVKMAIDQHNTTNSHHPEYYGGLKEMPDIALAEMACDLCARGSEFGTDVREWVEEIVPKRYNINTHTAQYKILKSFINKILEKPFQ